MTLKGQKIARARRDENRRYVYHEWMKRYVQNVALFSKPEAMKVLDPDVQDDCLLAFERGWNSVLRHTMPVDTFQQALNLLGDMIIEDTIHEMKAHLTGITLGFKQREEEGKYNDPANFKG